MPRLIIMRHAKSSWDSPAPTDHGRPLNERGRRDAPAMAQALIERDWVPNLVLSSDSQRTRETWSLMSPEFGAEIEVRWRPEFYLGGATELVNALEEQGDTDCVLVLGHNPGWEHAASYLSGVHLGMTTANCVLLEADGEWRDVMQPGAWTLVEHVRPRDL